MLVAKVVALLLLPPGIIIVIALLGLILRLRWPVFGGTLVLLAVVALFALSLPITARQLLAGLETDVKPLPTSGWQADAIVVLAGGRLEATPEYGGDTVSAATLERLRYAARLHRATRLPLLVSGGSVYGEPVPEAELMRQALEQDFGIAPKWVEGQSRNTYENASYSKTILEASGVRKVLLVTHAAHMPRAEWAFRAVGLETVAAPTAFATVNPSTRSTDYFPSAFGLIRSSRALHEYLGLGWYRLRYPTPASAAATGVSALDAN